MNSLQKLLKEAEKAYQNAYAPYSHFKVGASILSSEGNFYKGCNVENISYPCGTCAEAGAISAMISNGDKKISEILILADSQELIKPCGTCLQRIQEFSDSNSLIHLANKSGIQASYHIKDMLPLNFTAKELKK